MLSGTPHGRWSRPLAAAFLRSASPPGAWLLCCAAGAASALFAMRFLWRFGWHAFAFLSSLIFTLAIIAATNGFLSSHGRQAPQRAAMLSAIAFFGGSACRAGLPRSPAKASSAMLLGFSSSQLSKALMPQLLCRLAPRASPACRPSAAAESRGKAASARQPKLLR